MGLVFDSWWEDFLALVITLAAGFVLYLVRVRRSLGWFNMKRPPLTTQAGLDLKILSMRATIVDYLDAIYRMFPGEPAVTYSPFFNRVVLVRDPAMVEKVLVKDFGYFHDHLQGQVDTRVNPLEGNLFNMAGGEWRALRARLAPVFSSAKLKGMSEQVVSLAVKLAGVVPKGGEEFLMRDYFSRFAIDVIGSTAFGFEAGALEDPDCEFRKMALRIFKPTKRQLAKAFFRGLFPKLFKALKMKSVDDEVNQFFFSITKQAFEHRAETGTNRGDFVDLLLQLRGKGKIDVEGSGSLKEDSNEDQDEASKLMLTDELLTAQSFIFLVAGWETVVAAMNYTLYFLAKHQDVQDRLRDEVRAAGVLDYESLKSMAYLDACIAESLRMQPPAQALIRVCTKDYLMVDDSTGAAVGRVKRETPVVVPVVSIHMDPSNYPSPDVYDPGRFMDNAPPRPGSYLPFGNGPRLCIAQRFALMEVKVAMAVLVDKFKLVLGPKTVEPLTIDPRNVVNDAKGGIWFKFYTLDEDNT